MTFNSPSRSDRGMNYTNEEWFIPTDQPRSDDNNVGDDHSKGKDIQKEWLNQQNKLPTRKIGIHNILNDNVGPEKCRNFKKNIWKYWMEH